MERIYRGKRKKNKAKDGIKKGGGLAVLKKMSFKT